MTLISEALLFLSLMLTSTPTSPTRRSNSYCRRVGKFECILTIIEKTSSTTAVSNVILITEPGKLDLFLGKFLPV
jgi:hypothetical protein